MDKEQIKITHTVSEILPLLNNICRDKNKCFHLAFSNTELLKKYFSKISNDFSNNDFIISTFEKGETIVDLGKIKETIFKENPSFRYAKVPLGFIAQGEVIIVKGGKATKKLSEGDFIGLFETSDWIITKKIDKLAIGFLSLIPKPK